MLTKQNLIDFEANIAELYRDCKLPFLFHLSGGNESQLIKIFKDIKEGDYVFSTHRNHYHALLHGIPAEELTQKILDGRSMFIFDRKRNFFTSAIIGGTAAIAAGVALALKKKGSPQKVWCFVGDGTEDSGHLSEAIRYVEGWDLPCTFIIENNNRSVCTPSDIRWGRMSNPMWYQSCVRKYNYNITWPHARTDDKIDLSKTKKKTDDEYFPPLKSEELHKNTFKNDLTYKEAVVKSMNGFNKLNTVFIGYNVLYGNAMDTLKGVDDSKKIETPVAENLMTGLAIGMSFEDYKPVIYFERHDFTLVAADAIGNHLSHIERISHGEYKTPVIIRAITADVGPFYSGPTHSQDFTELYRNLCRFPVFDPKNGCEVINAFNHAINSNRPTLIVERKSLY